MALRPVRRPSAEYASRPTDPIAASSRAADAIDGGEARTSGADTSPRLLPVSLRWELDVAPTYQAMVLRGWTMSMLAGRAKVGPGTLSSILRGARRPRIVTVHAVCQVLAVDLRNVLMFPAP